MVTFVYKTQLTNYRERFRTSSLELKIFTVFALILALGSLLLKYISKEYYYAVLPVTGSIGCIMYLNPAIIATLSNGLPNARQLWVIAMLVLMVIFGIDDIHPNSYLLTTTIPGLKISSYAWLFSVLMPAIWIVILAIRPVIAFIQQRKLKQPDIITVS